MALPKPLTYENLDEFTPLEFVLLIGIAGTGKSYAILSLADIWQKLKPGGKIYAIDCETGLAKTYKAAFPHLKNILIWHGDQVNDSDKFIDIFTELGKTVTPDDWLCIESDTRVWDMCVPYNTPILTDQGELPIGQIVEKHLPVHILSYNHGADKLEYQPITDYFCRQTTEPLISIGSLSCTPRHPIYTEEGYIAANSFNFEHHRVLHYESNGHSGINTSAENSCVWQPTGRCLASQMVTNSKCAPAIQPWYRAGTICVLEIPNIPELSPNASSPQLAKNEGESPILKFFYSELPVLEQNLRGLLPKQEENYRSPLAPAPDASVLSGLVYGRWGMVWGLLRNQYPMLQRGRVLLTAGNTRQVQHTRATTQEENEAYAAQRQPLHAHDYNQGTRKPSYFPRGHIPLHLTKYAVQAEKGSRASNSSPHGERVYNLGIQGNANYFAHRTLVHNCQDTGWQKVTGQLKDKYLSHRLVAGGPVTPQPDQLWQVVLDAYRRRFRDVLVNEVRMKTNVLITTGLSSKSSPFTKASRQDTMKQLGIDISPDGHSENTRNPDTVILLSRESDSYWAEILKDRGSDKPGQRVRFKVESFLSDLMTNCR